MTQYRYGFYLRPDLHTSRAIADMHQVLRAQYGLISAGLFMPHVTIKGFYASDAEPAEMVARLDASCAGMKPFTAHNGGVIKMGPLGVVTSWRDMPDGTPNEGFFDAQDRAFDALAPLIRPDCAFTRRDPRGRAGLNPFHPHITLAMADFKPHMQDELLDFASAGGLVGPASFVADTYHLFRFVADWEGAWWLTLTWELLHTWRVPR